MASRTTKGVDFRMSYIQVNPTNNIRITSPFGVRSSGFHYGIDLGPVTQGRVGDPIICIANGIVKLTKNDPDGYGYYIIIEHIHPTTKRRYCSLYGHLNKILVYAGHDVKAGEKIAEMGNSGHSTAPHCHFEIRLLPYTLFFGSSGKESCIDPALHLLKGVAIVEPKDNTPDPYAKDAVNKAVQLGYIKGDLSGDLRLHENITRQDLMVVLYRAGLLK